MLIQTNWSIFALRCRVEWDASFGGMVRIFWGEMTHIIIHEKLTMKKAKLFTTTDLLIFHLFTLKK